MTAQCTKYVSHMDKHHIILDSDEIRFQSNRTNLQVKLCNNVYASPCHLSVLLYDWTIK